MGRQYSPSTAKMGNNSQTNKDFNRAAREVGLSESEKREFSKLLHDEKEFETGDRSYDELLSLAQEVKSK